MSPDQLKQIEGLDAQWIFAESGIRQEQGADECIEDIVADRRNLLREVRRLSDYVGHKKDCAVSVWQMHDALQKQYGQNYSAGPRPQCSCGLEHVERTADQVSTTQTGE